MIATGETYYMPAAWLTKLAECNAQNLMPVLDWAEGSRPFAIRDCFDQRLRLSRRLLWEDGNRMELLSASGATHCQAHPHVRRLKPEGVI